VLISTTFYYCHLCQYFCAKKIQSQNVTRDKLHEALSYKKLSSKMLMKLTPWVLRAAFMHADPESAKKTDNLTVFFALLGSARAKAARRTLMKLTPGWKRAEKAEILYLREM